MDTKPTIETVLERINTLSERVDNRIGALSEQFDSKINALSARVDARFNEVDARIDALSEHMDTRFNLAEKQLEHVENRLDRLQGGMLDLRSRFGDLHMAIKERVPDLRDGPQDPLDG